MNSSDAAFLYQYLVGLVFFLPGLLLGYKTGGWSFSRAEFAPAAMLIALLLFYMMAQAFFQFVAGN